MSEPTRRTHLTVDSTWRGVSIPVEERARIELVLGQDVLEVTVDAPYHDDPGPPGTPASHDGLWMFEVVELFLLGEAERYLEIELSPRGHWLVLELDGPRQVVKSGHPLPFEATIEGARWRGHARVPIAWLPAGLDRANAYAIHGRGKARRHLAAWPLGGDRPDFHRLQDFRPLVWRIDPAPA